VKRKLTDIFYSFPVQLLLLHLRSNLLLLSIWLLLTLFLTGMIGKSYGLQLLFLAPEYLGEVGFWSFLILGLSFGGLFMSWNLTCYLLNSHHFPFLASLERPFTKFCLNNSLLPIAFGLALMLLHVGFENHFMYSTFGNVLVNCIGFILGTITTLLISSIYFTFSNKDIQNFSKKRRKLPPNLARNLNPGSRKVSIADIKSERTKWRVDTYLSLSLKPRLVRSVAHYDIKLLMSVFRQNHFHALVIQLVGFLVLIGCGLLIDYPVFRIPAGASIVIICSLLCAFVGAVSYWFTRWRLTILLVLAIGINYITSKDYFNHKNKAYGLNYKTEKAEYSHKALKEICSADNWQEDFQNTIEILETWKEKTAPDGSKPKMIVYCVSGGGLKAAVWAMQVLQQTDSLTQGAFTRHTAMMSGASGGMIGTAYYRELLLQKNRGSNIGLYDSKYIDNISKDLLNSVAFTIASNDLFMPFATFKHGEHTYKKDRGYVFENQLNENAGDVFDKNIYAYKQPEKDALVPMMFFTPSIVNDGRRMIMSPHGVSYMMAPPAALNEPELIDIDAVDFGRLFANQDSEKLRYLTALRANATFPYILPNVYLPTTPEIEIMDAGFRDNFGLKSAVRFIHVFNDWILENTSGVVLVQVTGFDRDTEIQPSNNVGIFSSILSPLGIAGQVIDLQFYENDNNVGLIYDILGKDNFDIVYLTYRPSGENFEAPISFHLTERGRNDILDAIYQPRNQAAIEKIKRLLQERR
jgi:hypothetical protein